MSRPYIYYLRSHLEYWNATLDVLYYADRRATTDLGQQQEYSERDFFLSYFFFVPVRLCVLPTNTVARVYNSAQTMRSVGRLAGRALVARTAQGQFFSRATRPD